MRGLWVQIPAMALVVLSGLACGGKKPAAPAVKTEGSPAAGLPAPGSMAAQAPEPMELESSWVWRDVWSAGHDPGVCTLQPFGFDPASNTKAAGEFVPRDVDPNIVLVFAAKSMDAGSCKNLRVHASNADGIVVSWARQSDLAPGAYPFSPERVVPLQKTGDGVFEVEFSSAKNRANWNDAIRLLRIDPTCKPGATLTLQKIEIYRLRAAVWADAEPLKPDLKPSSPERAAMLKARADAVGGVEELLCYAAAVQTWQDKISDDLRVELKHAGLERGKQLLDSGDAKNALRVVSSVARACGDPVGDLYAIRDGLSDAQRTALWPKEPFITLVDFSVAGARTLGAPSDTHGRELKASKIDPAGGRNGGSAAMLDLTDSKADGGCDYVMYADLPLGDKPFAMRTALKAKTAADVKFTIGYAFPNAKKTASSSDAATTTTPDGWDVFDLRRNFARERQAYAQSQGYDASDGRVYCVGLTIPAGPANTWWLDNVEIYIPAAGDAPPAEPKS